MIPVEWTAPAKADLARIDDDLADTDPDYADRVSQAAISAGRFLSDWPHAGSMISGRRRKWPVSGTPYILLYRTRRERIEILRVRHERENWRRR